MTITELRQTLINKINTISSTELLEDVNRLISVETVDQGIYELSSKQIQAVEEARQQYQQGQFLTDEQANEEIDKCLGK
jgi:hypothetical protein